MKSESLWYKNKKSSNSMVIKWPFLKQNKKYVLYSSFCFVSVDSSEIIIVRNRYWV